MGQNFSRLPRSRLLIGEIWVDRKVFVPYEHNFPAQRENFLFTLFKIMSRWETLPGNRDNISPYEQNKII